MPPESGKGGSIAGFLADSKREMLAAYNPGVRNLLRRLTIKPPNPCPRGEVITLAPLTLSGL